jgi:hypothetical protein
MVEGTGFEPLVPDEKGLTFRDHRIELRPLFLRGKKQLPAPQGAGVRMPFAPPSSLFAVRGQE